MKDVYFNFPDRTETLRLHPEELPRLGETVQWRAKRNWGTRDETTEWRVQKIAHAYTEDIGRADEVFIELAPE